MSRLHAVNCGNTQMLRAVDTYDMEIFKQAEKAGKPAEVMVYMPEYGECRRIVIEGLSYAKDGWGVEHLVGMLLEDDGVVQVTLYDNAFEADPLNLR